MLGDNSQKNTGKILKLCRTDTVDICKGGFIAGLLARHVFQ
jgi:hypothetical protein